MASPGRMSPFELMRQANESKVRNGQMPAEEEFVLDESTLSEPARKFWAESELQFGKPFPEPWDAAERARKLISQQKYEPAKMLVDQILSGNQPQKWIWAKYAVSDDYAPVEFKDYIQQNLK